MNVMFNRCILLWAVALASPTLAQSLQDRPDGPQQPRLLNERRLPEAHGHSIVTHSQTDPIDAALQGALKDSWKRFEGTIQIVHELDKGDLDILRELTEDVAGVIEGHAATCR